jgi:beta-lactamase class A
MKRAAGLVLVGVAIAIAAIATWLQLDASRRSPSSEADNPRVVAAPHHRYPEHTDALLEARLKAITSGVPARCGVVAKHLSNGAVARVNPDERIPLLSVVKLPVAIVVLDGVDQGRWTLSTPISLLGQDMHPRGMLGDRYPRGGGPIPLHKLLDVMMRLSDNSAADALMRLVGGPAAVTGWLERHGIHDLRVDRTQRGLGNEWHGLTTGVDTAGSAEGIRELRAQVPKAVHDSAAQTLLLDPRDTGTAEACVYLLERLWRGDLLSEAMTDTLQSILARCRTSPDRLPGLLPKGTPVARKTGTGGTSNGVTLAINDVGVIRLPNGHDVAIAVLIGGATGSVGRAERLIARVARTVFDEWSAPDSTRSALETPGRKLRHSP